MPFYQLPSGASPVLAGVAPPTGGIGQNGDLFIDTAGRTLYGPKAAGSWPTGIDLSFGPTGVTGSTGPIGPSGPTGVTGGIAFTVGPTAPTAPDLTVAGAVWLDQNTGQYFVRYDTQFIEIGVQGERGPTGVTGASVTGPTGAVGAASAVTGPTGQSITGPTGASGAASTVTGPTGAVGSFSDAQLISPQVTGYTLVLADAGKLLTFDTTGTVSVIVPAASSVAFPTGTHVDLARLGTGAVQVTGATGVTVNATPGTSLRAQYSAASMVLYQGDKWIVVGDLS